MEGLVRVVTEREEEEEGVVEAVTWDAAEPHFLPLEMRWTSRT